MNCKRLIHKGLRMKKIALAIVAILILFASNSYAANVPDDVQAAYDNKQYDQAITKINEAIKKDKRNEELYYLLGKSYLKLRKVDLAQEAFEKAVSIKSKFHQARYDLGKLYLETDQLEKAQKTFTDGLDKAKDPKEIGIFEDGLGLYFMKIGDDVNADIQFRKALLNDPDNITYIMHQGDVAYEGGIYAIALNAYNKALAVDSGNAELFFRIAKCKLNQKDFQGALEAIDKTLELDSSYTDAYLDAGNIYTLYAVTQKDEARRTTLFSSAIFLYDKYLAMTGDSGITNYYRGKAYFTLNDFEHAVQDFEAAHNSGVDKEDLLSLIGRSYAKLKDYNKAIEILNEYEKKILSDNPQYEWKASDAPLFLERANAYAGLADSASRALAAEDYQRALELDTADAMTYYKAGLNLYYLQDFQKALDMYMKHIEMVPDNAGAYLNIAYCYLGMKDWENTVLYCNKALELNPEYTSVFKLLANVYFQKKDYNEAIEYYGKAKEVEPSNCEFDRWIGLIHLIREDKPNPAQSITYLKKYQACLREQGKSTCDDIDVYIWIAKAYQMQNDVNNAFDWYKKCLKCDPGNEECQKQADELEFEID